MSNHLGMVAEMWFRLDDDVVNDPKVQNLPENLFKAWINILCLTSKGKGVLPDINGIAFGLRVKPERAARIVKLLSQAGLLDEIDGHLTPHNWNGRQHKSDVSTERVKRFRKRQMKRDETVSETSPEQNREQNRTERKKDEDAADAAKTGYFFEAGVIRLNESDFKKWEKAFINLNLRAELFGLQKWASEQKDWFFAVSGALAKRDRQMKINFEQSKREDDDPRYRDSGIPGIV